MQVSANLGFFWKTLPLEERFLKASQAGFKLVETHVCPLSIAEIKALQKDLKLQLLQINAGMGDLSKGEFGLGANPLTQKRFLDEVKEGIDKCASVGAKNIHCVAGDCLPINRVTGYATLIENLKILAPIAAKAKLTIVLEPLNTHDRPNFIYSKMHEIMGVIASVGAPNIKIMADIYHIARSEGDVFTKIKQYKNHIGHFQVASVPFRKEITEGEIDFKALFRFLKAEGFKLPIGLEYNPETSVEAGLSYMKKMGLKF